MAITPLPTPGPDISDPATFPARASAQAAALPTLVSEINAAMLTFGPGSPYCTVGGTANAITLTSGLNLSALVTGQMVRFVPTATNTAAVTLNLDTLGAVAAKTPAGNDPYAGYIRAGVPHFGFYTGTVWIVWREPEHIVTERIEWSTSDLPAPGTAQGGFLFSDGAVAGPWVAKAVRAKRAGRIVGADVVLQGARASGTAKLQTLVGGVVEDFNSGSVELNATNTERASDLVAYASGRAFAAGDAIQPQMNTNIGWSVTPAGANGVIMGLTLAYDAS